MADNHSPGSVSQETTPPCRCDRATLILPEQIEQVILLCPLPGEADRRLVSELHYSSFLLYPFVLWN
jgi:hypothetical protein